jgi:long-subunit acyl-CoA synthetase (AMP-forming)
MTTFTRPDVDTVESIAPRATDLVDAFARTTAARADSPALRAGADAAWMTWGAYAAESERAAQALASLGVGRGDTVALMLRNRPEFHPIDTGALALGAIPFSIYNTSAPGQIAELLVNSGAQVVITEAVLAPNVTAAAAPGVRAFSVDSADEGVGAWDEALAGRNAALDLDATRGSVSPDDVAAIIYTSGTTGPPKGVQLTHANLVWMARAVPVWWRMTATAESLVSYLPMAHVAERIMSHYIPMLWGWPTTCCDDPRAVGSVLAAAEPSVFFAPPRLWEKLQAAALAGPLADPGSELGRAFTRRLERGRRRQSGKAADDDEAARESLAPVREAFGLGRMTCALASAASVAPSLLEFWRAVGVPLIEGYGLSEASAGVCMDDPVSPRIGTVGLPLPGVELRLADDGELLVHSPSVMVGYRGRPDLTAEAVDDDGWLHTGDIAEIDNDGRVRIVDRKKELIIGAGGKNMSPANIEATIKSASPIIAQACCIGDARPYNVALLVLDPEIVAARAPGATPAVAAGDPGVLAELSDAVDRANAQLSRVEQIKRFAVLGVDWLPDSDELTPTMKLKRRVIVEKYAGEIETLYAG